LCEDWKEEKEDKTWEPKLQHSQNKGPRTRQ
jgi:hypothetical protein